MFSDLYPFRSDRSLSITLMGLLVALVSGGVACGPETQMASESADTLETTDAAIINGTNAGWGNPGVVLAAIDTALDGYTECSAVMLTPNWMLTAKHCVDAPNSSWVRIYGAAQPAWFLGQAVESWRRTLNSGKVFKHPTEDVALVYFTDPQNSAEKSFRLDYTNPIFAGTSQDLVGRELTCYGYGNVGYGEVGTIRLRSAKLVVTKTGYSPCILGDCRYKAHGYYMPANELGQVPWYGDSGGPCFVEINGGLYVTGIAHKSESDPAAGVVTGHWQAGADYFRDWVYSTTGKVAATPCTISDITVTPASIGVAFRWRTSVQASNEEVAIRKDGSSEWRKAPCVFSTCRIRTTSHQLSFTSLTPGTTYQLKVGGECRPEANALAPVTVTQQTSFTTLR